MSTANLESLVDLHDASVADDNDDVDSLPSASTDDVYSEADSDAQAEWERSLEQLQLILTMMIVPWMGKYFGRKFAYWSWARYMEWVHNVDVRWTNKKAFKAAGAVEAAATL
ncbi:Fc.00g100580.m01.CDS01 [Cosmosporella sp. VM-42]